ncbi:SHOCT domain-containing protein [Actinomadura sp. DC4]|uniref:SHOCT domain-containing protein n=1 Tax=Actinomadura sp. DC4 TaxID=3055069 RepID=UPI0025B04EAF|nr:SHOCT domain-containing protein [Actinomadura sp. DC4]MDN3356243.1 SHOCT domain-containing protein [Actinomadura sp. DC4]
MTVGRISLLCWLLFLALSLTFVPLIHAIEGVGGLPARTPVAVVVVMLLWWGPFAYGMYLAIVAIMMGDPRLLRRGVRGRAVVLSAGRTPLAIGSGGYAWNTAPILRYHLRVSVPGRTPYETACLICDDRVRDGMTVDVAVAPHNRRRVAVDLRPGRNFVSTDEMAAAVEAFSTLPAEADRAEATAPEPLSPGTERIHRLVELDRLHREGEIDDTEYAAEKSRIIKG